MTSTTSQPAPMGVDSTAATDPRSRLGLHRYAVVVAVCTGLLVFAGGLVTSTGSGLSVPDWPLSYGKLMPPMVGGVRFEHGHRMVATTVGMLTIGLAVWLWKREPRRWVRRLGLAAVGAVILQGVLGGLTVLLLLPAPVSTAHACLGQTFFCIVVAIALFTSPEWRRPTTPVVESGNGPSLRMLATFTTAIVFVQLLLGATMRHIGAGLAIPDFPLAFGRLVPHFTTPGIAVHFAHRVGALVVLCSAGVTVTRVLRKDSAEPALRRPALLLAGLVVVQILLGATTVWTAKAVVPTTLHVLTGALVLATSLVIALRAHKYTLPQAGSPALGPLAARRVAT